jgi:serine/threonine protein kinase
MILTWLHLSSGMTDTSDTPHLDGWPSDPTVTYDPGRTLAAPPAAGDGPTADGAATHSDLASWAVLPPAAPPRAGGNQPAYRLHHLLGSGGFGEVWQAEQTSLGRVVALKRPRREGQAARGAGPATLSVGGQLFRQEALVTAALDHPGIVPVHDLGLDEDGEPILAMKLVRGRLWKAVLDEQLATLPVAEYLAQHLPILLAVAQATAYAHAHGVIHRDIKPGQVIVGEFGEAFLTDWGLAVRLAPTSPSPAPRPAGSVVCPAGTAAYMAPEQTDETPARLGPWTDVYLLGGVLYTVLTGRAPHPGATSGTAFQEAREGFVPPASEAAGGREVPAELAALAERCLSPDPSRRPASARAFIQELQAFLSGAGRRKESEALVAEARRRLGEASESYRELSDSLADLDRARAAWPDNPELDPCADQALSAWARAALAAGDLALARVQAERVHDEPTRQALLADVESAQRRLLRERRQRRWALGAAASLLVALAVGSVVHVRSVAAARDRAERALAAEAAARGQVTDLLSFLLGDLRESLAPIGKLSLLERVAEEAFEQLRRSPPKQEDVVLALRARALETLGDVLAERGSEADAATAWRDALAIREDLAARHPEDGERQRELASSLIEVSRAVRSEGSLSGALQLATRATGIRDRLAAGPGGDSVTSERARASDHHIVADMLESAGNLDGALAEHRTGLAILEACVARAPDDVEVRRDLAVAHSRVGDMLAEKAGPGAALNEYRAYEAGMEAVYARDPYDAGRARELATAHNSIGWALRAEGDLPGALRELVAQRELMTRLVQRDPSNASWRRDLAQCRAAAGQVLAGLKRYPEALTELDAAAVAMESIAAADPSNRGSARDAAVSRGLVAKTLLDAGQVAEAARMIPGPLATIERLAASDPGNAQWQGDLAKLREWHAKVSAAERRGPR